MHKPAATDINNRLKELARLFIKLGTIGFGGPAVHIALMEEEVVRKKKWMDHAQFLDLVGATNLIPGPNSTEMTMHIGRERAGWKGLVVAGSCFIIPAVLITGLFAWLYSRYGQLPSVQPFIAGIKPAILSVLVVSMMHLAQKAVKNLTLALLGLLCFIAALLGVHEVLVLFGAGLAGMLFYLIAKKSSRLHGFLPFVLLQVDTSWSVAALRLFLVFLKIGAILYGSGYVLFAFLDAELVSRGWLSRQQLVDAIAVGQFTPGPVFSSATFIGWQLGGLSGATAATIGIFLPAFLFVALLNPLLPYIRKSLLFSAFLDTVNVASVALILAVVMEMGRIVFLDWKMILIAVLGFGCMHFFRKMNTAWIILGGALAGYLLSYV